MADLLTTLSGLFGKKNKPGQQYNLQPMMPQNQLGTGNALGSWYMNALNGMNYTPGQTYNGKLSAGPTSQENYSLSMLDNLLRGGGTGDLFNQASQQISDTLSGKYANPANSPYIQAITELSNRNLSNQLDQSRAASGARGNFFGTSSLRDESRLRGDTLANLNAVIGDFANTERGRQYDAASIAQQFDKYKNMDVPLSLINAGQTYGSLGRTLEQADLERQYQDFLRQRGEQQGVLSGAQNYYGTSVPYGIQNWQGPSTQVNNTFGNVMDILGALRDGGIFGGGGGGQTSGGGGLGGGFGMGSQGGGANAGTLQQIMSLLKMVGMFA